MPTLTPDPSFYPSPKDAMKAPREKLAYVVMLNANGNGRPDALGVVDLDPDSSSYGQLLGQTDMPHPGDELHHFGWNACSSCLCPWAPHPHMERRYLIGTRHPEGVDRPSQEGDPPVTRFREATRPGRMLDARHRRSRTPMPLHGVNQGRL